jgi:hypothetical protein
MKKHTAYSFLELLGILFILAWLFGCSNTGYTKEVTYRPDLGHGQKYEIKIATKK